MRVHYFMEYILGCWLLPRSTMLHYNDVIMSAMAFQITSLTLVYSTVFFRRRSKKTSELRVAGLYAVNSPVTGEIPTQRTSNAETISIWWRHHACISSSLAYNSVVTWCRLNIKTVSPGMTISIIKITVMRQPYLYNGNLFTGKTTFYIEMVPCLLRRLKYPITLPLFSNTSGWYDTENIDSPFHWFHR